MKSVKYGMVLVLAFSTLAFAAQENTGVPAPTQQEDELCGELYGVCGNGWCHKWIEQSECMNGGDTCLKFHVNVVAETPSALEEMNTILEDRGEGTSVCVKGNKDDSGVFHILSVSEE